MSLQIVFPRGSFKTTTRPFTMEFCFNESVSTFMSAKIGSECKAITTVIATVWPNVGISMASAIEMLALKEASMPCVNHIRVISSALCKFPGAKIT